MRLASQRRLLLATLALATSAACVDASRINASCTWADPRTGPLDLTRAADREHLRQDAQLAGDLGVRRADTQFRNRPDLEEPIQAQCTAALFDTIAARHSVRPARVFAATFDRLWWADLLAVYLPIGLLVAFAADRVTRRICGAFDPDQRAQAIASIAACLPVIALFAVGVAQFWAFGVEGWFLRNEHVAFRAFVIPIMRHGYIGFFSALGLTAVVALARFRVTPIRRSAPSYQLAFTRPKARADSGASSRPA